MYRKLILISVVNYEKDRYQFKYNWQFFEITHDKWIFIENILIKDHKKTTISYVCIDI